MLHNGLYEQIINKGLDAELSVTDKLSQTAPIDSAEASKVLSKYVIYPKNKFIKSDEKTELKDKLSEVSTKKNQIETILLHMTDGIIAFNMSGEIILINPAAKKFLSISPEDNTFNDIFSNSIKILFLLAYAHHRLLELTSIFYRKEESLCRFHKDSSLLISTHHLHFCCCLLNYSDFCFYSGSLIC